MVHACMRQFDPTNTLQITNKIGLKCPKIQQLTVFRQNQLLASKPRLQKMPKYKQYKSRVQNHSEDYFRVLLLIISAQIFLAVVLLILSLRRGPFLIRFKSQPKQTKNSQDALMFLKFWMFYLITSSVTASVNLLRRIYCAFLIRIQSQLIIYSKPHFTKSCLFLSSLRFAVPNRITNSFLDLMSVTMKMFHILCAIFYSRQAFASYFILISFLIVTTACFWKLWLSDFFSSFDYFETELEFLASFWEWKCSSSFQIGIQTFSLL